MKIRTLQQVHGRSSAGHTYSAGEGRESIIDDTNTDMVDLIRLMASRGQVEILEDVAAETVDDDDPPPPAAVDTTVTAPNRAAPAKKTTTRRNGAK